MRASLLALLAFVALASCSIPTSFDARQKWSHCKWTILDQGRCGSCWDFASSESFGDRACITGEASSGTIMSPEPPLDCSKDKGCNGGNPNVAWDWWIDNGDCTATNPPKLTGGCCPYDLYSAGRTPSCHAGKCDSGSNWNPKYTAKSFKSLNRGDDSQFQTELMNNGPLQSCFTEYSNFQSFFNQNPTGVYTKTSGSVLGGHCVKMIGWGVQGGTDYWLFANSWNTNFADKGYFKFQRGKNLCGIENQVSEGFTKSGAAKMEAQGWDFSVRNASDTEAIGGNWVDQEDMEDEMFVKAALFGLEQVNKNLERNYALESLNAVRTQVVAGVNFDLTMKVVDGPQMKVRVWRSYNMVDYDMTDFELMF